jgi:Protein of unknown function (DUF4231)
MDATFERLTQEIAWYDLRAKRNRVIYLAIKVVQIALAAAIPVIALLRPNAPSYISGILGGIIAALEGIQQLGQFQQNWLRYRSTCESLRNEDLLYGATAGPYASSPKPAVLLAERMSALLGAEGAAWRTLLETNAAGALKDPAKPV